MAAATAVMGQNFTMTVSNQYVSGTNFIFDINITVPSGTVYLGDCNFVLTFNSGNFSSPSYNFISSGGSKLADAKYYTLSGSIVSGNCAILNVVAPTIKNQHKFDTEVEAISGSIRIATMQITGISNPSGMADLMWRTESADYNTYVNNLPSSDPWSPPGDITDNGTYTNPSNHSLQVQAKNIVAISNQHVSGTNFIFDITMTVPSGTVYLGDCNFVLTFNSGNFSSPSYNFVSTGGSMLADTKYYSLSGSIVSGNCVVLNVVAPTDFKSQQQFDNRVEAISGSIRIATMQITGIIDPSELADLIWRTESPDFNTYVNNLPSSDPWSPPGDITGNFNYINPADHSLPVQMANIHASARRERGVVVHWQTESETDCAGFHVLRSETENSKYSRITTALIHGHGNSSSKQTYEFEDRNVQTGKLYWYKIEEVSTNGVSSFFGPVSVEAVNPVPAEYMLSKNYPNPFNPRTTVAYQLPNAEYVVIRVCDMVGKEVKRLVDTRQNEGYYKADWNGTYRNGASAASGNYFIWLEAGSFSKVQKVILMR